MDSAAAPTLDRVTIQVTGQPVAKGRPRVTKTGVAFTPAKTRKWEADARMVARAKMAGRPPLRGPLLCEITAVFPIPVSWPRWKRALCAEGRLHHTSKPDGDNVAKAAKDAMNGIAWLDDAQVVELLVSKRYGNAPAVTIDVAVLPGASSQAKSKADAIGGAVAA